MFYKRLLYPLKGVRKRFIKLLLRVKHTPLTLSLSSSLIEDSSIYNTQKLKSDLDSVKQKFVKNMK